MTTSLKQRIVGAIFILSLGVILIPFILDKPTKHSETLAKNIPDAPELPQVSDVAKIHYVFDTPLQASPAETTVETTVEPASLPEVAVAPAEIKSKSSQLQLKAKESLAAVAQSQWTIQLGAFSSEENAKVLMQTLASRGFQPYIRQMANDHLVRVYVSPGVSRDQAVVLTTKLDTDLGLKGIVVRYFD